MHTNLAPTPLCETLWTQWYIFQTRMTQMTRKNMDFNLR